MPEISRNAKAAKIWGVFLGVAILICDIKQAISATLMDSSEALAPKKKARIVNSRLKFETAKIHAIVRFQPKVAAILNRGHPYM